MARGSNGSGGKTKPQRVAEEVARAVGAGRAVQVEALDFSDPKRPKSCLEFDFPILPVNQVAAVEGNAGKPIYQMSKWWARRRSSVFRSLLLSAAMKAPEDTSQAAKAVWDVYYANHQKKRSFANIKVADIFMGGGTTVVEGSRLGMQMFGNDLNPVAWFVVKTELAQVKKAEVEALLADIEAEVKPQVMPYYACRGPAGERGKWTRISDGQLMDESFDPLALKPSERKAFKYEGPEIIYIFWAKHGPCQVTGCGHRTPVMSSPVVAVKEMSVKFWAHRCPSCGTAFDIEEEAVRMAPDVPLAMAPDEGRFATLNKNGRVECPACKAVEAFPSLGKGERKKVALSLLAHPEWLAGEADRDSDGLPLGGSFTDDPASTSRWYEARARHAKFLEVRGVLPAEITCPASGVTFRTAEGTVPRKAHFACGACGKVQDVLSSVKALGRSGQVAPYVVHGYSPELDKRGSAYNGRFFAPADADEARRSAAAHVEWAERSEGDLADYWPRSEVPYGFMTHHNNGGIPNHGFTHWWTMFNPRQLLVNALLLKSICTVGGARHSWETREYALAAFQQYLRNQNMFCFWDISRDCLAPHMSNNNYHPKATMVENCVFPVLGRGNWLSCSQSLVETREWADAPWEVVSSAHLSDISSDLRELTGGKNQKAFPGDSVGSNVVLNCGSATDLTGLDAGTQDLVITDPPFGGLLHYSELADFFYVWLRLPLRAKYPALFESEYTPKSLEAVSNRARHPDDADEYYERLLTASWKEAHRILKPGGTLAFTFHHSEDAPWVSVLESLFEAGFYLEATWPIRSDETKGEGSKPGTFGSQKIEYDIVHVCRKRTEDPSPVSWAKMRRQVLQDVRSLKHMLEHHQKQGLPDADLQVIRRGKALEYFSRHYGKVLIDDGRAMSVLEALVGINQLLDEEVGGIKDPPPVTAEPFTRQFLRLFDGVKELPRDQMQKFLRGTGIAPSDFEARGWCAEEKKVYKVVAPLDVARAWQGKHRRGMTSDYDQAAFLIGACCENSGINATDTLANDNFKPHPALGSLLEWFATRGASSETRNAASRAQTILRSWRAKNEKQVQQMSLFFDDQGAA